MLHIGPGAFQYRVPKTHVSELRPGGACITIPDAADESKGAKERKIAESAPHSISDGVGIELPAVESVVHSYNSMLTTTSPNSVLLASLDAARAQFEEHGADMVQQTALAVNRLRSKLRLQGTYIECCEFVDAYVYTISAFNLAIPSKLVIMCDIHAFFLQVHHLLACSRIRRKSGGEG